MDEMKNFLTTFFKKNAFFSTFLPIYAKKQVGSLLILTL